MRNHVGFDDLLDQTLRASRDLGHWRPAGRAFGTDAEREALRAASLARVEADMARGEAETEAFPELLDDAA